MKARCLGLPRAPSSAKVFRSCASRTAYRMVPVQRTCVPRVQVVLVPDLRPPLFPLHVNPQGVFVVHNKLKDKSGHLPQELLDGAYFKWVRRGQCGAGGSVEGTGANNEIRSKANDGRVQGASGRQGEGRGAG